MTDMTDEKTPIELWEELRDLVMECEKDANKATRGMRAGGVRLRSELQKIRDLTIEMRKAILEYRADRRKKQRATPTTRTNFPSARKKAATATTSNGNGNGNGKHPTEVIVIVENSDDVQKPRTASKSRKSAVTATPPKETVDAGRVTVTSAPQAPTYKMPGKGGVITEATICQALGATVSELVESITDTDTDDSALSA